MPENPDPNVQTFVTSYKAKYRSVPDQFAAQAYDAVGIMLVALQKAGPTVTRESLRDALAQTKDYPGVTGSTTFELGNPRTREVRGPHDSDRRTIRRGEVAAPARPLPPVGEGWVRARAAASGTR